MKKTIVTCAMGIFLSAVFLSICGQSTPDAIRWQSAPHTYHSEKDSASRYRVFKTWALLSIRDNDRMLVRLSTKIDCGNKQSKTRHFSDLVELQLRNNELKRRVSEYREHHQDSEHSFEQSLLEDINKLKNTIREFRISTDVMI
jgi:hypothetical protein